MYKDTNMVVQMYTDLYYYIHIYVYEYAYWAHLKLVYMLLYMYIRIRLYCMITCVCAYTNIIIDVFACVIQHNSMHIHAHVYVLCKIRIYACMHITSLT